MLLLLTPNISGQPPSSPALTTPPMSFLDEAIFPEQISVGSTRSPRFNTAIVQTDGGSETRFPRWTQPLHRFAVQRNKLTRQLAYDLAEFFWGVQGATYGFRYKDWGDYATTADGSTVKGLSVSSTDAPMLRLSDMSTAGVGDGVSKQFQLAKQYTAGFVSRWRNISKPLGSSVVVAIDGTPTASGWTLDDTSGIVTFDVAPGADLDVTWGGEFYVPCRFSESTDADGLLSSSDDYDATTFSDVEIDEIRADDAIAEAVNPGGSASYNPLDSDVQIGVGTGRAIVVVPDALGRSLLLPSPVGLGSGMGYWWIRNNGSFVVSIESSGLVIGSVPPGFTAEIGLISGAGGALSWAVFS